MAVIAISAGHNFRTGARALDGADEWSYNTKVADELCNILHARGHTVLRMVRDKSLAYGAAMRKLADQMREAKAELALELHFNCSNTVSANGFEFLHYVHSPKGRKLAQALGVSMAKSFPTIAQRGNDKGARSLYFHEADKAQAYSRRGGEFCYHTPCPAVVCEPFFASSPHDYTPMAKAHKQLAAAYADGIESHLKG